MISIVIGYFWERPGSFEYPGHSIVFFGYLNLSSSLVFVPIRCITCLAIASSARALVPNAQDFVA